MATFYRAFFRCTDDPANNLIVDLLVDDRRRWVEKVPTGGWWGRVNSNDIWPFILRSGGQVDFGNTESEPTAPVERYGSLDISDKIIVQNEYYSFSHNGAFLSFQLDRLTDVASL